MCVASLILFTYVCGFMFAYCQEKFDGDTLRAFQSLNTSLTATKSYIFQQSGTPHKTVIKYVIKYDKLTVILNHSLSFFGDEAILQTTLRSSQHKKWATKVKCGIQYFTLLPSPVT